jgi:hypothetical protein
MLKPNDEGRRGLYPYSSHWVITEELAERKASQQIEGPRLWAVSP